jgi:hypothetical protein
VRAGEGRCPHCDARFAGGSATRRPRRQSIQVGRVIVASALAGLSTASCGGRVGDESVGTTETRATTLAQPDAGGDCVLADGGSAQCDLESSEPACQCALPTACDWTHTCVPIQCGSGEYLDGNGSCQNIYWFTGKVPSSGSCYGAPPYLG